MKSDARTFITIDPGYARSGEGCAVAFFRDRRLVRVMFARPEEVTFVGLYFDRCECILWEEPQIDKRTYAATRETVKLAAIGGVLAGMFAGKCGCRAQGIAPSQWKGSLRKPQMHSRIWRHLAEDEKDLLGGELTKRAIDEAKRKGALDRWSRPGGAYYPRSWYTHNLLDAVGIGMWALGR
jgi:hypothetical protein